MSTPEMAPEEIQGLVENLWVLHVQHARTPAAELTGLDPNEFKRAIKTASVMAEESRLLQQRWVDAARRAGITWEEIGRAIGLTRQQAQQKFRNPVEDSFPAVDQLHIRKDINAFNEMGIMRAEGLNRNELQSVGFSSLAFRKSAAQWEYERFLSVAPGSRIKDMEKQGWVHVGSWFPYHYLKRPLE